MNLTQIREKYPDYNDLSDEQLARGFHRKFYTDMPWNDFKREIEYIPGRVIEPKEMKVEKPSFIRDVVGQTAKDVAGVITKVGAGYAKGMTLGAIDIEEGKIGIPFTSIKKQIAPALAPSLEKELGVSPEIAENPYIGIPTEFLGVVGPWSMASKLVGRGVGYLQAIRIGKNLMKIADTAKRTEAATSIIKSAATRTVQQAITGGIVGAAHVREEDESLLRNVVTYAAFGAGLQMLGEGINVIATSTGLSRYGAYKNLKKDLSDLLYKNRKEPLTKGEVEDIADLAINEQLQKAGIQKATRKDLNQLRKSTKVIRTKIEKARAERGEPKVEPTPEEATAQAQAQAQTQKQDFLNKLAQDIGDPANPLTPANVAFMGKSPEVKALGITQTELNAVAAKAMGDTTITSVAEDITAEGQKALEKFYDELEEVEPVEVEEIEPEPTFKEEREFWEEIKEEPGIQEVRLKKEPTYRIGEGKEPKEGVWYKTKKGELVRKEDLEEVKTKEEIKPTATFRGWQETAKGDHIALYNIKGGRLDKSTVAVATLEKERIEIPETPKKPPTEVKIAPTVEEKVGKVTEPIPKVKEPWEMTKEEYVYGEEQLSKLTPEIWKENFGNIPYLESGKIKIYRGAFQKDRMKLEPGDWVTLDKKFAKENYAGPEGKVFEKEVPISELKLNIATSQPGKSELIWKPEVSLEAYTKEGKYIKLTDKHKKEIQQAIKEGKIKSHPDYPELGKVVEEPIITRIEQRQAEMDAKYAPVLGTRIKSGGMEWEFVANNDIGIPYFSKVVKGKVQKKQFTVSGYKKAWLDEQLKPELKEVKEAVPKKGEQIGIEEKIEEGKKPETKLSMVATPELASTKKGKKWIKASKRKFGITTDLREAGYILPDGIMLDFSGKREGGPTGTRALDHREIGYALEDDTELDMISFMTEAGAIRFGYPQGDVVADISGIPTKKQLDVLQEALSFGTGYLKLDVSNNVGDRLKSIEKDNARIVDILKAVEEAATKPDNVYEATKPAVKEAQALFRDLKAGKLTNAEFLAKHKEIMTRLQVEPALTAKPEGYEFTPKQTENFIRTGQPIIGWLKKAGADQEVLDRITIDLKPIMDLKGRKLSETIKQWEKEGISMGEVLGGVTISNSKALIELALNGQNLASLEKTTYHEWYHIAKRWILPGSDIKALSKQFKTEEGEADAFADYMKNAKTIDKKPSLIKRIFLKLKRMINIIRNGLKGKGFHRPEDIFGKIRVRAYRPRYPKVEPETLLAKKKISKEQAFAEEYVQKALGKVKEKPIKKPVKEMDAINELYAKAIERADRVKNIIEVKRLRKELELIGGSITTPSEMRKMRQIIHAWKYYKGITDTQYRDLVKKTTGHLSTLHKDIDAMQLKKILRKIQKIRPRQVGYKKVITEDTENRIKTLENILLGKGEITEEIYADILNSMRIKEPVYISRHRFITETQGKEVIDKMLKSVPIAKLNIDKELKSQPAIKKEIDKLESHFKKEQKGKIKVISVLDMHHFADSMQKQSGAKFGELYEKIRTVKKNTDKKIDNIVDAIRKAGGTTFTDITKTPKAIQRINDYVASKLSDYIKGKPKFPKNITPDETNIAKTIIAGLKGKEAEVRYHRFYEWRENNVPIPNAPEKELNTATEILETQGDEALKKWLSGRSWGIKRTGYDAGEVINPTIKRAEIKPGFGKRGLRTSESIEYLKSEKDILKRYASYMRQMTYRTELKSLIDAWTELFESNKHRFENPYKVADLLTRNVREILGRKEQLQILEKFMVRAYSQAARTIFLDLRKGVRNLFQNLAFYTDLKDITKLKKLLPAEKEFFATHVSQMKGIQRDWLYQDYRGMPGLGKLNEIADLINVMGRSDTINRLVAFKAKIGAFEKVLEKYPNIETNSSELEAMMKETKWGDLEPMQRLHTLKILAKEGKKPMALYWTKAYVEKVHFLYERFERAPAEQGREISRILSNLLTFRKGYVQRIILDARKLRRSQKIIEKAVEGRKQVVKSLIGVAIMGTIASWLYQKLTGDDREPYRPDKIIGDISVGGIATGMQEQIGDITRDMLGAATGDKNALGRTINGITRAADVFLPFYDEAINAIEGLSEYVNIDKAVLRQIRNELDKRYKAKPMKSYRRERDAIEAGKHIIFGTEPKSKEGKKVSAYY